MQSHAGRADSLDAAAGDIYLFEVLSYLWMRRWLISAATLVCGLASIAAVLLMPPWYRAEVLLAPAEERSSAPLIGQLGGLANLVGIRVGGGSVTEAVAVLQSRDFTRTFVENYKLLPILFADEWDSEAGAWRREKEQPDIRDAVTYFDERVRVVSYDRRTELVSFSILWKDAELAASWANTLAEMLNDQMRSRALKEAEENIEFLRGELNTATAVVLQQATARLLENEMQKLMLARGNKDFAFRIIDSAQVPKKPAKPRKALIVVLVTGFGGVISALVVILYGINSGRGRGKASAGAIA